MHVESLTDDNDHFELASATVTASEMLHAFFADDNPEDYDFYTRVF